MLDCRQPISLKEATQWLEDKPLLGELCDRIQSTFFVNEYFAKQGKSGLYFVAREDPFNKESPIVPLTREIVLLHLIGQQTIGTYALNRDNNTCRWACLDFDCKATSQAEIEEGLRELRPKLEQCEGILRHMGFETVREFSGRRGYHLLVFFNEPVPGLWVHTVFSYVKNLVDKKMEVYPKQAALNGKSFGNQIKLPLALHKASGKRSVFIDKNYEPIKGQLSYVFDLPMNVESPLARAYREVVDRIKPGAMSTAAPNVGGLIEQFLDPHSIRIEMGTRDERKFFFVKMAYEKGWTAEEARTEGEKWLFEQKDKYESSYEHARNDLFNCVKRIYEDKYLERGLDGV